MNPDHEQQTRPTTFGIMGTPLTSGNRGVLALGAALVRLCLDSGPATQVTIFGSHPEAGAFFMRPHGQRIAVPVVHWRMSPRSNPRDHLFTIVFFSIVYRFMPVRWVRRRIASAIPWIGALEKTDLVGDVRGGDSFSDIYGLKRFLLASLPVLSVIMVKRSLALFPQTYGPYKGRTARWLARWIVRHSTVVVARDKASQAVAQELAAVGQTVLLSPDVAFALHSDPMDSALFDHQSVPEPIPANAIGLNVNGLMFNGGYTGKNMFGLRLDYRSFVTQLAEELLATHSGPLVLVPHTYAPLGDVESDNAACQLLKRSLAPSLQPRVRIVTGDYDAHRLKGIIARCEFFVGSRMHSCIAALSQGVPCVGVAYSMKFRGVFESVGMADWVVDGRTTANREAIDAIIGLYHRHPQVKIALQRSGETARLQLGQIFKGLLLSAHQNRT